MNRFQNCRAPVTWTKAIAWQILVAVQFTVLQSITAAPLPPGGSVVKPTLSPQFGLAYTAGRVPANYSNLVAMTGIPYLFSASQNGAFSGFVTSSVWQDPATKNLAFSYRFNNLQTPFYGGNSGTDIVRVTIDDPTHPWVGFSIVDAGADGTGHSTPQGSISWNDGDPFALDRDSTFQNPDIQFRVLGLGTSLLSQTSDASATIWFATDAKSFTITNVGFLDGGNTGSARTYSPSAGPPQIIPEPSSWILMAIGSGSGLVVIRRRRRGN